MKQLKLFYLTILLFVLGVLSAQEKTLTGQVFSAEDNKPLVGAYIYVQGSKEGVTTNAEGKFIYPLEQAPAENAVLEASYSGTQTEYITIEGKDYFEIYLASNEINSKEVVITSFYRSKKLKQEVVGSIATVTPSDLIIEQPAIGVDELLVGQVAGVYIQESNQLGAGGEINIRGLGTLTSLTGSRTGTSSQPMIIVDGVIMNEELYINGNEYFDFSTGRLSEDPNNPLAKIGLENIESINVLKDAAAVSLYGANGANGVILITTKKGKKGKLRYNFSANYGVTQDVYRMKYMDGQQYRTLLNEYYTNEGNPSAVSAWNGVNTDWYDLLNRTGSFQRYNFDVSGGKSNFNYRLALGYEDHQESQVNNEYQKYTADLSLGYSVEKFSASVRFSPSYTVKNDPNTLYNFAVAPDISVYNADGTYFDDGSFSTYGNPLAVAHENRDETKTNSINGSFNLEYRLLEGLKLSTAYGLDISDKDQDTFWAGTNSSGRFKNGTLFGRRILRNRNNIGWNWNGQLYYERQLNDFHYFDILAGIETTYQKTSFEYQQGTDFDNFATPQPLSLAKNLSALQEDSSKKTSRSFFSQLNYNFMKKYFLLANFRIDQNSSFGSDNDTAYNGGVGISWVLSKENFLKEISWIDLLRFRTSYGITGNARIGSYRALGLYTRFANGTGYNNDEENDPNYVEPKSLPNPNLGWEKNKKFNIGLDFNFLKRFNTTLEFFRDNKEDMIVNRDVVSEEGLSSIEINGADMYNQGWEFSFSADWFKQKNFRWTSNFNIATLENKITKLVGLGSDFSSNEIARAQSVGHSTSELWGFEFVGIDPATGYELFNVDGQILPGSVVKGLDYTYRKPVGNTMPEFYGGLNNRFTLFKNFSVAINMSFEYGADKKINANELDKYNDLSFSNLGVNVYYDHWKQPGDRATYAAPQNSGLFPVNSTKYIFDNSHIALRSVNLSYIFPLEGTKTPFKKVTINLTGSNLGKWYKESTPKGMNGIRELSSSYPLMRTYSFGISAMF